MNIIKAMVPFMLLFCFCAGGQKYDMVITGGKLIDGTGNPWRYADVGIRGDKIVSVGDLSGADAKKVIDASGRCVTPGFIDMHCHSDFTLLADGTGQSKIRQGVTLEIIGESESAGPVMEADVEYTKSRLEEYDLDLTWTTLGEYFNVLESSGISGNIVSYVGLGQVRKCVMGSDNRKPSDDEIEQMKVLIRQAMEEGAMGLATGMIYVPDMFFTTEEIIEMAKVASGYGGIYATHLRSEDDTFLEALDEAIRISKGADIPVDIFHFKASGKRNWHKMSLAIKKIDEARSAGVDITVNQYPYIAGETSVTIILPDWAREGGYEKITERLKNPEIRKKIADEMRVMETGFDSMEEYMSNIRIARILSEKNKHLEGKSIIEIAQGKDPIDNYLDLLVEENANIAGVFFTMTEENKKLAMKQPWLSICSDGIAVRPDGILGRGKPHPRYYGTFPRFIGKYVRDEKVVPLEDMIRKMTSLGAQRLGIMDRGLIRKGMYADICVFDYETIADHATFDNPHQYSEGIVWLLVNGIPVIEEGEHTGAKPGRVLYGPGRK